MKLFDKLIKAERFALNWRLLLLQGSVIGLMGIILGLASVFSPNAIVLNAREFSWLPMTGIVILSLGLLECLDAFLAKEMRDFYQNLHVGVLDAIVGGMIVFSISGSPQRLGLMIAAYLVTRGIVRIVLVYTLRFANAISTSIGGLLSILFGMMVFLEWPTEAAWFLALSLNIEIICRGWAVIMFGLWVKHSAEKA